MTQDTQTDKPGGERIAKVLARAGVASRRDAETMITAGRVAVNGRRITSPALNVTPRDRITVDGKPLADPEPARLWMYHKPLGQVTTARDEKGRETVFDKLPEGMPRVMPVGRLDINSEGLLLLTNDGELKRRLELPSTGWLRKYRVRVNGRPTEASLAPLLAGIEVEGERFQPMIVNIDRQQGANAWLTIGIREGRNREVRRAMEHVGLVVNRLIRVSYGPFQLGQLAPGAVSEVKPRVLRDQLGMDTAPEPERTPVRRAKPGATPARVRSGTGKPPVDRSATPRKGPSGPKPQAAAWDDGVTGRPPRPKGGPRKPAGPGTRTDTPRSPRGGAPRDGAPRDDAPRGGAPRGGPPTGRPPRKR